jgi:hypothetical protein
MLYVAEIAVCSEMNIKQINTVRKECIILSAIPVDALNQ